MRLGGRKGPEGEGAGSEPEPARWEGSDLPRTVLERRTYQGSGATAVRLSYGDDDGESPGGTAVLMAAPCGVGERCESSREGRDHRADMSGPPGGVKGSCRQDKSPVQRQLERGWGLDPPARAVRDARALGS